MASKQQQAFKMCVHPCPRYLTGGDTHILCVACLGKEHSQSALESAGCEHCDVLPLWTLRSCLTFFCEDAQARVPQGSGPAAAEAQRRLRSWGSQMDLSAEVEKGTALSLPSPDGFSASYQGWEARAAVSSAPIEAHFYTNYVLIGQHKGKTFVQEANLMNTFYLIVHNLNAGDYHFS